MDLAVYSSGTRELYRTVALLSDHVEEPALDARLESGPLGLSIFGPPGAGFEGLRDLFDGAVCEDEARAGVPGVESTEVSVVSRVLVPDPLQLRGVFTSEELHVALPRDVGLSVSVVQDPLEGEEAGRDFLRRQVLVPLYADEYLWVQVLG